MIEQIYHCDTCHKTAASPAQNWMSFFTSTQKNLCPECSTRLSAWLENPDLGRTEAAIAMHKSAYDALSKDFLKIRKQYDEQSTALETAQRTVAEQSVLLNEMREVTISDLQDEVELLTSDLRLVLSFLGKKRRARYAEELSIIEGELNADAETPSRHDPALQWEHDD